MVLNYFQAQLCTRVTSFGFHHIWVKQLFKPFNLSRQCFWGRYRAFKAKNMSQKLKFKTCGLNLSIQNLNGWDILPFAFFHTQCVIIDETETLVFNPTLMIWKKWSEKIKDREWSRSYFLIVIFDLDLDLKVLVICDLIWRSSISWSCNALDLCGNK